jgi:transcription elongation factor SPT6
VSCESLYQPAVIDQPWTFLCRQPEKLDELNLDAFAEELERQGFGNKQITLYDIRTELNEMYKDIR